MCTINNIRMRNCSRNLFSLQQQRKTSNAFWSAVAVDRPPPFQTIHQSRGDAKYKWAIQKCKYSRCGGGSDWKSVHRNSMKWILWISQLIFCSTVSLSMSFYFLFMSARNGNFVFSLWSKLFGHRGRGWQTLRIIGRIYKCLTCSFPAASSFRHPYSRCLEHRNSCTVRLPLSCCTVFSITTCAPVLLIPDIARTKEIWKFILQCCR